MGQQLHVVRKTHSGVGGQDGGRARCRDDCQRQEGICFQSSKETTKREDEVLATSEDVKEHVEEAKTVKE